MKIATETLDTAEVAQMRLETEWEVIAPDALARALAGSLLVVSARNADGALIGMVRAIGDGVLYAHVQDLIVARAHRGEGIAGALLDHVLGELDGRMVNGSAIGLMAVAGLERFYATRGFASRPSGVYGAGMTRIRSV